LHPGEAIVSHLTDDCFFSCCQNHYFANQFESATMSDLTVKNITELNVIMPKKAEQPASFETSLAQLEQIVSRLESGDLPLEEALNEFERGVQLARTGQQKLQQAEQRVQILLNDDKNGDLQPFTPEND